MPEVIGRTPDGRDIVRYDPSEGCRFRCLTCGDWLARKQEVRGHWLLFSEGHSVFVDRKGRTYHQTIEGLQRRGWPTVEGGQTEHTEGDGNERH